MARPLSEEKKQQLIQAAIGCIFEHGLSASTAMIAKSAGVASGSLFTYFANKEDLLNAVYLHIKQSLAEAVMAGFPHGGIFAERLGHLWQAYIAWGLAHPEERKVLKQLAASALINEATHNRVAESYQTLWQMFAQAAGENRLFAPLPFAVAVMEQMVEATIGQIEQSPEQAQYYAQLSFDMMWRAMVRTGE